MIFIIDGSLVPYVDLTRLCAYFMCLVGILVLYCDVEPCGLQRCMSVKGVFIVIGLISEVTLTWRYGQAYVNRYDICQ